MKSKNIVHWAMQRPLSVVVAVFALALTALLALKEMPRDILPNLGVPVIYVAQPYGGMDAAQMESYMTYYYEYHFLYISGIEHIESKNIQSTALIKLQFHPGTDMAQALASTINYVNRARAFMPEGIVPPFVMRFDAGSEPVGNLVFTGENYSLAQLQNFALNYVRPLFATLPGVSAPPPFGASQRTVVIRIDPKKLREYNLSPYDVADAISQTNRVIPSGNIPVGNLYPAIPLNSIVKDIKELDNVPLRTGTYPTVFLKDVGHAEDASDIQTGYALVNGKRTVYIPVTKRAEASTLAVVDLVKKNLAKFQNVLPEGVKVSYEFDQSGYVRRSISSLVVEGILGAILTALMVLLFLRDWRSSVIVVLNIPLALMGAIVALWLSKQTINIMTLGGLALAIGILVDETTVTIENIHAHLARGKPLARAALDATLEILKPALLTLLCILAVFLPSFFMTGVSRALFVPLTLAVGFSILSSFLLSRTLVPVLATWLLSSATSSPSRLTRLQKHYAKILDGFQKHRKATVFLYLALTLSTVAVLLGSQIGREIFPRVDVGQFRIRFRAPAGTQIDRTEAIALRILNIIQEQVGGQDRVESSVGFVGAQPPTYPINTIYLWTSGSQEGVLDVALKKHNPLPLGDLDDLKERLRKQFKEKIPDTEFSFEASGLLDRIMSQGSATPIEIAINGRDFKTVREFAAKVKEELAKLPSLRDLQYGQLFEYPTISVNVDRAKAGIHGLTIAAIGKALVPATSSSRFVVQNYWSDPKNGINYQVQVEVPQGDIHSIQDIKNIPVAVGGGAIPLQKFAEIKDDKQIGEFDRYNMQRMVTLTANLNPTNTPNTITTRDPTDKAGKADLTQAGKEISKILKQLEPSRPKGVDVHVRGQIGAMNEIFSGLTVGLILAVFAIFLLLSANFESTTLSFVVLCTLPAVLSGVSLVLWVTGTTLNIQSFMGTIMAIGVAVANAILFTTFAERTRVNPSPFQGDSLKAAAEGAQSRLRPILMTSMAMIAGMVPMALGLGEGGQQTAPLGRAVIGGLAGGTLATLFILPLIYSLLQRKRSIRSSSLDPDDPESRYFSPKQAGSRAGVLMVAFFLAAYPFSTSSSAQVSAKRKLSIPEVLQMAEKTSPELKAGAAREIQAEANVAISKASLYPQFHLSAVDSWGFPGSSVPAPPQFGGLIASPFRAGPGAGILGRITLLDLGNWRGVQASEAQTASTQEQNKILRMRVDQAALTAFFDAIRFHGHQQTWEGIQHRLGTILTAVRKLVKTGQYAQVQRLLIEDQFEEAKMKQGMFDERFRGATQRLSLLTGRGVSESEVPIPGDFAEETTFGISLKSPFLTHAEAETRAAKIKVSQSSAEHLPKVYALGSAGVLNGATLVDSGNYSAWVGVTIPLFEGFRIISEVNRAQAVADEKENDLASAHLALDELNSRYDENIRTARLQLRSLQTQRQGALEAFKQAKDRFLTFLGPVIDLREAVRDLARIEIDLDDAKMDLLLATGSKVLVNGGTIAIDQ